MANKNIRTSDLKQYHDAIQSILDQIQKRNYPVGHPFLQYPNTPESQIVNMLALFQLGLGDKTKIIETILKKCRSVENGHFDYFRYLENIDEFLVLYYIYIKCKMNSAQVDLIYEPTGFMDNNKKLEYSFYLREEACMLNFEVKTMLCDPFYKEKHLPMKDGAVLLKRFVNDLPDYEEIRKQHPEAIELTHSSYYSPFKSNITRIARKFDGRKQIDCRMINIGVVCVHLSPSMEEFYACLFHKEKGFFRSFDWGNLDALVLLTLDAKNDILLDNVYQMGYVQTVLLKEDEVIMQYLKQFRLDHYISIGDAVFKDVYEIAQKSYGLYRIFCRDGFLNIIPYDSDEDQRKAYLEYLKGEYVRYGESS